ncbi:aconitase X swivel domain-containing protein [Clostridium sp. DL1XJH146]
MGENKSISNIKEATVNEKRFKGRVIIAGEFKGKSVVSKEGVNTLATFQKSALKKAKEAICADQNNPDLYNKNLTGKVLCLPTTIGSTTGGLVLQTVCKMGIAPSVMLFSEHIDSLAAAGVILSDIWTDNTIIAIDQLGEEFLSYMEDDMEVEVMKDGEVIVRRV